MLQGTSTLQGHKQIFVIGRVVCADSSVLVQGKERLLLIQNGSFAAGSALVVLAAAIFYGTADEAGVAGA